MMSCCAIKPYGTHNHSFFFSFHYYLYCKLTEGMVGKGYVDCFAYIDVLVISLLFLGLFEVNLSLMYVCVAQTHDLLPTLPHIKFLFTHCTHFATFFFSFISPNATIFIIALACIYSFKMNFRLKPDYIFILFNLTKSIYTE